MKKSQISKQAWALIAVSVVIAITSCTSSARLPSYVHKGSDGTVRIDVGEASGGSAELVEPGQSPSRHPGRTIVVHFDDYETEFVASAFSLGEGLSYTSLQNPPLRISPVITPGNDVADFFSAVWVDDQTQELHVTLFLDTDWSEVIEGPFTIFALEAVLGRPISTQGPYPVDFSEAIHDVYVRELIFQQENNLPGYNGSPNVVITNMSGKPFDVLERWGRLELEEQEVLVHITGRVSS